MYQSDMTAPASEAQTQPVLGAAGSTDLVKIAKRDGERQPGHSVPQDQADVLLVQDTCESVSALTRSGAIRKALLAQCLLWVYGCYRLLGV